MPEILEQDITGSGLNQGDLVKLLTNIKDVVNEIQADHATVKTFIDELKLDFDRSVTDLGVLRTAITTLTAKLDLDATVTDSNYAATCNPAAITATTIAATAVATLTNSTALKLTKG
jgi:hypothetical protein